MSYIGNQPLYTSFLTDTFSGNGSTVTFTLSVAPTNSAAILVTIGGILQSPSAYGVVGTALTFTGVPPAGTNNITVRYLGLPASNVVTSSYRNVTDLTASAGQTTFATAGYTPGFIDVFRNGVRLAATDYTATNGATVVLVNPAVAGDTITTVGFYVSSVLNALPATAGGVGSSNLAPGAVGATALDVASGTGNGAMTLPTGTTAQRPASPTVGMHRWNTTLGAMEVYVGGVTGWQTIASSTYTIDYLVVGGGGGGGIGGGGAGGFLQGFSTPVSPGTSYTVTIGGGGSGGVSNSSANSNGNPSSISGIATAVGGGAGGWINDQTVNGSGKAGGSGGGASRTSTVAEAGGSGTAGQGNNGGSALIANPYPSGGGGGAGSAGANGAGSQHGVGGSGAVSTISGSSVTYAGGGGGGGNSNTAGAGGSGGGGAGSAGGQGVAGGVNLGGGGGGTAEGLACVGGGSGVVIIRYAGNTQRATGGTVSISGGYVVHTFLSSSAFVA